jgi:hypothetical protein
MRSLSRSRAWNCCQKTNYIDGRHVQNEILRTLESHAGLPGQEGDGAAVTEPGGNRECRLSWGQSRCTAVAAVHVTGQVRGRVTLSDATAGPKAS